MMVTGQQVKDAMIAANIVWVESHRCCFCSTPVGWERQGDKLLYQSSCDCCSWHPPEPRDWDDAAHHINMQTRNSERFGDIAAREALLFGITLPRTEAENSCTAALNVE